jgi:tetratricopeptide (TPR) repeat protein
MKRRQFLRGALSLGAAGLLPGVGLTTRDWIPSISMVEPSIPIGVPTTNFHEADNLCRLYRVYCQQHDARTFIIQTMQHYSKASLIRLSGAVCTETRRAATLMLGFVGTYQESNNVLGRLLKDSDRNVRLNAESSLKSVWSRDGSEEQRQALYQVMRHIAAKEFGEALRRANVLLDGFPFYAEAINQRAITLFALQKFEESIEDSRMVLDLNPYHFGAAMSMGYAYFRLRNKAQAIASFRMARSINPNLLVREYHPNFNQND